MIRSKSKGGVKMAETEQEEIEEDENQEDEE
jgi:hypothetical protein